MTPEEQKDLELLKEARRKLEHSCFELQKSYLRMTIVELSHAGHTTAESAVVSAVKHYAREIEKLAKDHVKKYPD